MKTIFFDVTDLLIYVEKETSISGIQRVSFEVIKRAVERLGSDGIKLSYWDRSNRSYVAIESDFLNSMNGFSTDALSAIFFGKNVRPQDNAAPTLVRYRNNPIKYKFHYAIRSYHALVGNETYFTKRDSSIAEWRAFKTKKDRISTFTASEVRKEKVSKISRSGDQLIILGAVWGIDGLDTCFHKLKHENGIEVRQLIHDLIPIITPEHIAADFSQVFYDWLELTTSYCTSYFANSQNTAKDLQAFMTEIGQNRPVTVVSLAQKFNVTGPSEVDTDTTTKAHLKSISDIDRSVLNLSKYPYVLVVGTLESRKNLWRLAQVWQRLSAEVGLNVPKLVFAGKRGWYNDDFDALMKATGNIGGWIQFADRPSDTELAFLYKNCLFTVLVSFYEGWGLPIGESLSFGKTAVVADNSALPEVGGDLVEYCDAHSIDSIYAACRNLIDNVDHRKELEERIGEMRLRTWDDVTQDFIDTLK